MAVAVMACLMVSCAKDDFNPSKPIRVQGEIDPGFSLPLIAQGQMNLNDLLTSFGGALGGALLEDTLITFHYDTSVAQTIDLSSSFGKSKNRQFNYRKPYKSGSASHKSGAFISVDTTITYPIALDFFDQIEDIDLTIAHLWLNMGLFVRGYCPETTRDVLRDNTHITLNNLKLRYIKKGETDTTDFDGNASLNQEIIINDFIAGASKNFDSVNMASLINDRPQQIIASIDMHLSVDSSWATTILADPTQITEFTAMLDSLRMDSLTYTADLSVDLPFEIGGSMSYEYDIPISQTTTNGDQETSTKDMVDTIKAKLKNNGITFDLDSLNRFIFEFDNGIPLNLKLNAAFVDANGNVLDSLFTNGVIAAAVTAPSAGNPGVSEAVAAKTSRVYLPFDLEMLENLQNATNVKFNIELSANGTDKYKIQRTNYLNIRMKLQLHPSLTIDMPIFNNNK